MTYTGTMDKISLTVGAVGVAVILLGLLVSSIRYLSETLKGRWAGPADSARQTPGVFRRYRQDLGRSILLGLEFLIAGDIIRTVAVEPTFDALGTLAILVAIRSFLSWSLSMEIDGRWPWQTQQKDEAVDDATGLPDRAAPVGAREKGETTD